MIDSGEIVEDGETYELFMKKSGPFYELVKHVGPANYQELIELAKSAKNERMRKTLGQRSSSIAAATARRKSSLIRNITIPIPIKSINTKKK